jgi:[ribosomal protein S5]-alanine N-acetyltransferase
MEPARVPVLRSFRLVLRPLCAADHAPLLAMAQDAEVTRYLHEGPAPSAEDVHGRIARAVEQWERRGYGMMAVEDAGGFVGRLGAFHPADAPDPLLVYALQRSSWGKGYATEAVPLFLDWMRTAHGSERLPAHIDPRNTASIRVAAKLGAVRSGTVDRAGSRLDLWVFPTTR